MNTGLPTDPQTILTALRTQISTATGINQKFVHICLDKNWFEPGGMAEKYVVVTDFNGVFDDGWWAGGGNFTKKCDMTMKVCLYTRLDVDQVGSDFNRLTQASMGLLPEWVQLMQGISAWLPTDGAGVPTALLIQPAIATGFSIRPRNFRTTAGWTEISTSLSLSFVLAL